MRKRKKKKKKRKHELDDEFIILPPGRWSVLWDAVRVDLQLKRLVRPQRAAAHEIRRLRGAVAGGPELEAAEPPSGVLIWVGTIQAPVCGYFRNLALQAITGGCSK
jgi:hypothetical protein